MVKGFVASAAVAALLTAGGVPGDGEAAAADKVAKEQSFDAAEAAPLAGARDTRLRDAEPGTFIVRLDEAPVAGYEGSEPGLDRTKPRPGRGERLDATSAETRAYRQHLATVRAGVVGQIEATIGRALKVEQVYDMVLNGFAAYLTPEEARRVAATPGVADVEPETIHELHTDNGPGWIGAGQVWEPEDEDPDLGTRGEGVLVGVIDTGIVPSNPSFSATGSVDGYTHENPFGEGNYVGVCDPAEPAYDASFACNSKLVGAWDFVLPQDSTANDARDVNGHGSHTASTAAGNVVDATVALPEPDGVSLARQISGVAPHANIVSYRACAAGCPTSATQAAIQQALIDGVDVINYSIGGASRDPWSDATALAMLTAREAGVLVAVSAGNTGPEAATVGSPADAPWVMSVGASTHDRQIANVLTGFQGGAADATPDDIVGAGFTGGYGPAPVRHAKDFGDELCLSPFPPGTFDGEIVVCDRGVNPRVEKGANVRAGGAGGMVLANDATNAATLSSDPHVLPAVHVSYQDSLVLKDWLADGSGHQMEITGVDGVDEDAGHGDVMASFSSRGPNPQVDIVSPSLAAPGVDIIAAYGVGDPQPPEWGIVSGTSMASPHAAGAAALLTALHPEWTPDQIQSALMTTAVTDGVRQQDGQTPAGWYDAGAGRIDLAAASRAGLILDEASDDYLAADPAAGGDPKTLNLPGLADGECLETCSWTRTVTATTDSTWSVATSSEAGLELQVRPDGPVSLAAGQSHTFEISADVGGVESGARLSGEVAFTSPEAPRAHLPVAVEATGGILPELVSIDTRRDTGSQEIGGLMAKPTPELVVDVHGLAPAALDDDALAEDPANESPYDNLDDVWHTTVEVTDAVRLVAEVVETDSPDLDLFVGTGSTPSAATQVCASTTAVSDERCDIADPADGTWWVLVQNWSGSGDDPDPFTVATGAVPADDAGTMSVEAPAAVAEGEPFDIRAVWDADLAAGQRWYGALSLGSPQARGDIGRIPVDLVRHENDVTKTADVAASRSGETVTYEIAVAPNVTAEDIEYQLADEIPEGLTYVAGSATGGATVRNGTVSWSGTMPSVAGVEGDYAVATNHTDDSCLTPYGDGGYLDLRSVGVFPADGVAGDTVAYTAFSDGAPFQFYGQEYPGIAFTDDGFALFDAATNYDGQPWLPQSVPATDLPNNLIGMLWHDFEIVADDVGEHGVSLAALGGTGATGIAVIDYRGVRLAGQPDGPTYDFQLWMRRAPVDGGWDIAIAYHDLGPLDDEFTVATENAAGTAATALVNQDSPADVLDGDTVVCFAYQEPTAEPHVITYQATVDSPVVDETITNEVVHETDDPGDQPATASHELAVRESVQDITVSPERAKLRAEQTQQYTATGHLPGGDTVDVTDLASWTSDDETVISVDADGLATGIAGGKAAVTASVDGVSGSADAHVLGRPAHAGPPPRVTTTELPELNVFQPYEATLTAGGGLAPYTWTASGLPAGLELDPDTGVIRTDPNAPAVTDAAATTVTVTVTDLGGRSASRELPLEVTGVARLAAGGGHTCGIDEAGVAYCWGGNGNGQLGVGDTEDRDLPSPIDTGALDGPVAAISPGSSHTCAVTVAGGAYCWGFNGNGQLGTGDNTVHTVPARVEADLLTDAAQIATGWQHTCAVDAEGAAYCWGSNFFGQLGNGEPPIERHTPWPIDSTDIGSVAQIAAYAGSSCAISTGRAAYCWGYNGDGQVGDGSTQNRRHLTPVVDDELGTVSRISMSPFHTCAVSESGVAYCWGSNGNGQLGDGSTERRTVPAVVSGQLGEVRDISAGEAHSCAVTAAAGAYCWGLNRNGQLGDGTTTQRPEPAAVVDDELGAVDTVSAGGAHSCAVTDTAAAYCWGWNNAGQLGDGTGTDRTTPVPVHPGSG